MALKTKLLIIPCCKAKHGTRQQMKPRSIDEFISDRAASLLHQSRKMAFQKPYTSIDRDSKPSSALVLYSGTMYSVDGFRDAAEHAIDQGMHVLVESGGYGLIRAEEPIHNYEAQMNRTASVWRRVLPIVLADYISRNNIDQVYVAGSMQYVSVLSRPRWWEPATCRCFVAYAGRGNGNPYQIVPRMLGEAVRDLLEGSLTISSKWISI